MSKKNQNKDNKGAQSQSRQNIGEYSYELIIDQQKRELLENSFMIKKLQ